MNFVNVNMCRGRKRLENTDLHCAIYVELFWLYTCYTTFSATTCDIVTTSYASVKFSTFFLLLHLKFEPMTKKRIRPKSRELGL